MILKQKDEETVDFYQHWHLPDSTDLYCNLVRGKDCMMHGVGGDLNNQSIVGYNLKSIVQVPT